MAGAGSVKVYLRTIERALLGSKVWSVRNRRAQGRPPRFLISLNPSTYRFRQAESCFEVRFALRAGRAEGQPRGRLTSGLDHQKALSPLFRSLKVAFEIPSSQERRSRCSQSGHWRLLRLKKPAGENEDCEAHTSSPSRSIDERGRSGLRKGLVKRSGPSGRLQ